MLPRQYEKKHRNQKVYFFEMVLGLLSFTFLGNKQVGEGVNRGGERLNRVGYDGRGSLIKNYKKNMKFTIYFYV